MDVKTWYITGKGYVSSQCTDSLTGDSFSDIYRDWSQYIFTGTEDELDDMLLEMSKGGFKETGTFVYKSEEYYMFVYGKNYKKILDEENR